MILCQKFVLLLLYNFYSDFIFIQILQTCYRFTEFRFLSVKQVSFVKKIIK